MFAGSTEDELDFTFRNDTRNVHVRVASALRQAFPRLNDNQAPLSAWSSESFKPEIGAQTVRTGSEGRLSAPNCS